MALNGLSIMSRQAVMMCSSFMRLLIGYKAMVPDDRLIDAIRQTTYSTPKDFLQLISRLSEQAFTYINQAKRTQTTYFHAPSKLSSTQRMVRPVILQRLYLASLAIIASC